jgi:hypothetical protein
MMDLTQIKFEMALTDDYKKYVYQVTGCRGQKFREVETRNKRLVVIEMTLSQVFWLG